MKNKTGQTRSTSRWATAAASGARRRAALKAAPKREKIARRCFVATCRRRQAQPRHRPRPERARLIQRHRTASLAGSRPRVRAGDRRVDGWCTGRSQRRSPCLEADFDGVFTAQQAARGKIALRGKLRLVPRADLTGASAPALKGEAFLKKWEFHGLNTLVSKVFDTMPKGYATNVQEDIKVDIVSYILQQSTASRPARRADRRPRRAAGDSNPLEGGRCPGGRDGQQLQSGAGGRLPGGRAGQSSAVVRGRPDRCYTTSPAASLPPPRERLAEDAARRPAPLRLVNASPPEARSDRGTGVETKGFSTVRGEEQMSASAPCNRSAPPAGTNQEHIATKTRRPRRTVSYQKDSSCSSCLRGNRVG